MTRASYLGRPLNLVVRAAVVGLFVATQVASALGAPHAQPVAGRPRCAELHPGQDIQAAIDGRGPSSTFCFGRGVYRLRNELVPKRRDSFIGKRGAVLSGAIDISRRFTPAGGGRWMADFTMPWNTGSGQCNETAPLCTYPHDVFLDGRRLKPVQSIAQLRHGDVFFTPGQVPIWVADDPRDHRVEVSVASRAFRGWQTEAYGVTIRGLMIEKFASEAQTGAIQATSGWRIINNEIRLNHGAGVQGGQLILHNNIHDNGQLGISLYGGNGAIVSGNVIDRNNFAGFDPHWEAGGAKFMQTTNLRVSWNLVDGNKGPGLWTDWDNVNTTYENNRIKNNFGSGIEHECSYAATIKNNIVRRNGFGFTGWLDGAGIVVVNSQNVRIYGNMLDRNLQGIGLIVTARDPGKYGGHDLQNVYVHNNVVNTVSGGTTGLVQSLNDSSYYTSKGNRFVANRYRLCAPSYFAWQSSSGPDGYAYVSKRQWLAVGNDAGGHFSLGC